MIRLVTQFDSPRARAQAGSPKSSACSCCCCCCVVTLIGTGVLTVRAVGRSTPPPTVRDLGAQLAGPADPSPFRPPGAEVEVPGTRTLPKARWKVFGFFVLPLAIALALLSTGLSKEIGVVCAIVLYPAGLFLLRARAGLRWGWVIGLIVGVPIAIVIEAWAWILAILK